MLLVERRGLICLNGDMSASSLLLVLKRDLDLITSFPEALEFKSKMMSLSLSDSASPSNCFFEDPLGFSFLSPETYYHKSP
jgi:hypothetical protein